MKFIIIVSCPTFYHCHRLVRLGDFGGGPRQIWSKRYGEAQRAVDAEYERKTGKAAVERRWMKRD